MKVGRGPGAYATAAFLVLVGCGGSTSGSGGSVPVFDTSQGYFDAGGEIFLLIEDDLAAGNFDDPAGLPSSGSVDYLGSFYFENDAEQLGVIGAMTLRTDFATSAVSGTVTNIVDREDQPVAGSLTISNGAIDRAADLSVDYTFEADVNGMLTDSTGETAILDAGMLGDFFNDSAQVYGEVNGTLDTGNGTLDVGGEFIAQQ